MSTPTSSIGIFDFGIRSLVYTKFATLLEISSINDVLYQPKEIAQREFAEKQGKNIINFANVWRTNTQFSWERQRTPVGRRGISLSYSNSSMTGATIAKAVPVDLTYQLTFWVGSLDLQQQLNEEYLFWIHSDPNLNISLNSYPLELDIHLKDIADNSTISNMYQVGKYFVSTCEFKVDGWLPRFEDLKTIQKIFLKGYINEKDTDVEVFNYEIP